MTTEQLASNEFPVITTIDAIRASTGDLQSSVLYTSDVEKNGFWYEDTSDTTTADNTGTVLATSDGKRIKRSYDFSVQAKWFGIVGDGVTDNTAALVSCLSYIHSRGGGVLLFEKGVFITDKFSLPERVNVRGAGMENTILKMKANTTNTVFVDLNIAYEGVLEDLTLDGNKVSQTIEIAGIKLNGSADNYNYRFMIRRIYVKNFTGDGIQAISPSFIFSVQECSIRQNDGYGIHNSSTDNGFFNNIVSLNKKGGIFNTGSNTRFMGGKILFNGSAAYPDSAGVKDSSLRSQYVGMECQENYYHGFYLLNSSNCIFTGCISDMNNVARRPLAGLSNIGDPNAVGYALKTVGAYKCMVQIALTSAAPSTSPKYTQFGKYIAADCLNNIFELTEQEQYGPDTILSGTKNKWVRYDGYTVGSNEVAPVSPYVVEEANPDVILISAIATDTPIVMPLPNQTTIRTLRITNRLAASNTNRWYIDNVPIAIPSGTATSPFKLPPNSIVEFEAVNSGTDGQWRCLSISKIVDPDTYELTTNKSDSQTLWTSVSLYPTKNAVNTLVTNAIKAGNLITKAANYTIVAADFGKNTVLTVLVDASANAVNLLLASAPVSLGYVINVVRLDSSAFKVSLSGRTVSSVKEPINGDTVNTFTLLKDRPVSLVSDAAGWRTINSIEVPRSGIFTISGAGQNTISIPHGLGVVPGFTTINPKSADARLAKIISWSENATNIIITLEESAVSGTVLSYAWEARI